MTHSRIRILYPTILALVVAAVAGCGNDETSAKSEEPSSSSGDKWFVAWGVEQLYKAQIRMDAINAGKNQFAADTSCTAMLPMAQKKLRDSSNAGMVVQVMYKTCNDAGLKFQNKVRCEADRLQVLCQ